MKRLLIGLFLALGLSISSFAQTSNSLPFTAVTPPPPPVLTSLGNLTTSGKIYTGSKMPILGTGFSSGCVVNVDGVAQASTTYVFISATEIDYTLPASIGNSTGVAHTATVTCSAPALTMNSPVNLPNGALNKAYSQDLAQLSNLTGGKPPYSFILSSGSLPTGLSLSQSGVVTGTPSSSGSFSFGFTVKDSSGLAQNVKTKQLVARENFKPLYPANL